MNEFQNDDPVVIHAYLCMTTAEQVTHAGVPTHIPSGSNGEKRQKQTDNGVLLCICEYIR
jgi:hypothetical protein